MHFVKKTVLAFLVALLCGAAWCGVVANGHAGARRVNHLRRDGSHGRIAVEVESNRFSESARVSLSRTRADGVKRKIMEGLAKKRRGRGGARLLGAAKDPQVLAMYDISIESNGAKWQPAAGEPAQVTVDLAEPVAVAPGAAPAVVHLSDDGAVEELPESRYGFRYNAAKTEIVSFWFSADGFSVYAITDFGKTTSNPGRRLYDFYSLDFDVTSSTYNQYVKRYFTTIEGNKTFRQIVKSGEKLVRPEVLPSPLGRTFIGWHLYDPAKANQTVEGVTYDSEGYATEKFDFDQDIVFDEPGEREYVLRALFSRVGYVVFHEQKVGADWPITAVRRAMMEEREETEAGQTVTNMYATVQIDDIKVTYDDTADDTQEHSNATPRMIFRGWSTNEVEAGSLKDVNGNDVILQPSPFVFNRRKDTEARPRHLYPVFVNINWLTFQAARTGEGATYIPPKFFYADEGTNKFAVATRMGYTFKGWYTAETGGVQVADENGNLKTNASLPSGWGGTIENGRLKLTKNVTIYGQWEPAKTKYMIVILKQSIEDDVNLPDEFKTYDFYRSYPIDEYSEATATVTDFYKNYANVLLSGSTHADDFKGFYYRACDSDQKVKNNGSTVLNVYYDRYKVRYTFNQSGATSKGYIYTPVSANWYTYAVTTNGVYTYVETNYVSSVDYAVAFTTSNSGTSGSEIDTTKEYYYRSGTGYSRAYRKVNNSINYWSKSNSSIYNTWHSNNNLLKNTDIYWLTDVQTVNTEGVQYGVENGADPYASEPFLLYYRNGAWRTTDADDGEVYTGTRYARIETGTQYGSASDNPYDSEPFVLYYVNKAWRTSNSEEGEVYTGTRYVRTGNVTETHYGAAEGSTPYSNPITLHFRNGAWRTSDSDTGDVYTGTHYIREDNGTYSYSNNSRYWTPMRSLPAPVMIGLYGQQLSEYGYVWPSDQAWYKEYTRDNGSGTQITYLDSFNAIDYPHRSIDGYVITTPVFYGGESGSATIYHVLQNIDGVYPNDVNQWLPTHSSGSTVGTFTLRDKFEGFKVRGYSFGSFTTDFNKANAGGQAAQSNATVLFIYHERMKFRLYFWDSANNNDLYTAGQLLDAKTDEEGRVYCEIYYGAPLAPYTPATTPSPTRDDMQKGYSFTGWFYDTQSSTRVKQGADGKFAGTMPINSLVVYAGWETQWFLIQIDPNGGQLAAKQSLWFWEPYNGDPIEEYTTVTRSFVESLDGRWFYAVQNRDYYELGEEWDSREDRIEDRGAYYTTNQSDPAIVKDGKRYENLPNKFRYAGWYQVMPDGSEELYAFGQPVFTNTTLRLHWKHLGTYHVIYDAGVGTIAHNDENETNVLSRLDTAVYADDSEILVTRTANPPPGYSFTGWKIRNGDGTTYIPGQHFAFNSAYTLVSGADAAGNPIRSLVLDAQYHAVRTVSLTTDANGGTVDPETAVTLPLAYPDAPSLITNITDTARTVSGMRNNAYGRLSDGTGYSCTVTGIDGNATNLTFMGWNTKADGTGATFAGGTYIGLDTVGTENEDGKNYLYAMWAVPIYFDKNNDNYLWDRSKWTEKWGDFFKFDEARNEYYMVTNLNGYATYPNIVADSHDAEDKMFAFWSTERYQETSHLTAYDFSTPVTAPLVLYAAWQDLITVPFHAVDASEETIVDHSTLVSAGGWLRQTELRVGNETDVAFGTRPEDAPPTEYVQVPENENYQYAFTCISDSKDNISEARKIRRVYFNSDQAVRAVWVEYDDAAEGADHGTLAPLPSNMEIFIVYFKSPKTIPIAYKEMATTGTLSDAGLKAGVAAPTEAVIKTAAEPYNMTAAISAPKEWAQKSYGYYSFAIGDPGATTAEKLRIITEAKSNDSDRPALQFRNTWRGFEYSLDGGETWNRYGYSAGLYIVYFDSKPTIVTLKEKTIGTEDDMAVQFTYNVSIKEITTTETISQTRTEDFLNFEYNGYTYPYTASDGEIYYLNSTWAWPDEESTEINSSQEKNLPSSSYALQNGGLEAITLFGNIVDAGWRDDSYYDADSDTITATSLEWYSSRLTQTRTRTVTKTIQQLVIEQVANASFTTTNDGGANSDGDYKFTYDSTKANTEVTFTNTRRELPVEFHVAFSQNGMIDHVDNEYRTEAASGYTLNVPIQVGDDVTKFEPVTAAKLAERNKLYAEGTAEDGLLSQSVGGRVFIGVWYGRMVETDKQDENKVQIEGRVTSIGFVKPSHSEYYEICLNDDSSLPLADYKLFYLYAEMPKIYYVAEGANGALTQIAPIELTNPDTNQKESVTMNGAVVAQGTALDLSGKNALEIAFGGSAGHFGVPIILDGAHAASLNQYVLAAGPADAANRSEMAGATASHSETMQLKFVDGVVKWSLDGEDWNDFTGTPAVYAIYKEVGYDLTIVETSLASETDKATDVFTVTISSDLFADGVSYVISGYTKDGVLQDKITPVNNTLTLENIKSGCRITIHALLHKDLKDYKIVQTAKGEAYTLKSVTINGSASISMTEVENGVSTYLNDNEVVEFTNLKQYNVTFVDADETTVLKEQTAYDYGTPAALPQDGQGAEYKYVVRPANDPQKPMDAEYIYVFNGWDPQVHDVTDDQVYKAKYTPIKIPSLNQRANNSDLTVTYPDQSALIAALNAVNAGKLDMTKSTYSVDEAYAYLNAVCPNGLKRWECLRTGTPENQLLLNTAVSAGGNQMTFKMFNDPGTVKDLGYGVRYVLRKYNTGTAEWDEKAVQPANDAQDNPVYYEGASLANPAFDIPLLDANGKSVNAAGYYRIFTQIVPLHRKTIVNEIPSSNIIGVLEVDSAITDTMTAVPWKALPSDPKNTQPITVGDYVQKGQLSDGDSVYVMNSEGTFEKWTFSKGETSGAGLASAGASSGAAAGTWTRVVTVKSDAETGAAVLSTSPAADCRCIERGGATWVERQKRDTPYFLVGQYFSADVKIEIQAGTEEQDTSTMITNPNLTALAVNAINWGGNPLPDDKIQIPTDTDRPFTLRWVKDKTDGTMKWGRTVTDPKTFKSTWRYDYTIPPGIGFWYIRRGAAFEITVPSTHPDFNE